MSSNAAFREDTLTIVNGWLTRAGSKYWPQCYGLDEFDQAEQWLTDIGYQKDAVLVHVHGLAAGELRSLEQRGVQLRESPDLGRHRRADDVPGFALEAKRNSRRLPAGRDLARVLFVLGMWLVGGLAQDKSPKATLADPSKPLGKRRSKPASTAVGEKHHIADQSSTLGVTTRQTSEPLPGNGDSTPLIADMPAA